MFYFVYILLLDIIKKIQFLMFDLIFLLKLNVLRENRKRNIKKKCSFNVKNNKLYY